MSSSGFNDNLEHAEDYNWQTGLSLELFHRSGTALATRLTPTT